MKLTNAEFEALDNALNDLEIYGHRGHVETEQATFGNNWKNKE